MECPKCGHVQADGPAECARCGLIFARWVERRSLAPRPRRLTVPAGPSAARTSPLGLLLGGVGTLFFALAAWHLWFGGGLPADRDAWRDPTGRFAFVLPSGWSLATPSDAAPMLEQAEGRFPPAIRSALKAGASAAFFRPETAGALAPWGSVTPVDGIPPPLRRDETAALASAAVAELEKRSTDYRFTGAAVAPLDRLPSLRVSGTDTVRYLKSPSQEVFAELPGGSRYPIGRTEDVWDAFDRSITYCLVPGRGESFVLTLACPVEALKDHTGAMERITDTFRVLKRPPLYGRMATPALRAAATVLLAVVLLYTLTEVAALRHSP